MNVNLSKDDLISLIRGKSPKCDYADQLMKRGLMGYVGGFNDSYYWEVESLKKLTEEELFELFCEVKENSFQL